ncbi:MAG: hypothetical protein ACPL7G_05410, partial [Chloroflexia bacterium]
MIVERSSLIVHRRPCWAFPHGMPCPSHPCIRVFIRVVRLPGRRAGCSPSPSGRGGQGVRVAPAYTPRGYGR